MKLTVNVILILSAISKATLLYADVNTIICQGMIKHCTEAKDRYIQLLSVQFDYESPGMVSIQEYTTEGESVQGLVSTGRIHFCRTRLTKQNPLYIKDGVAPRFRVGSLQHFNPLLKFPVS